MQQQALSLLESAVDFVRWDQALGVLRPVAAHVLTNTGRSLLSLASLSHPDAAALAGDEDHLQHGIETDEGYLQVDPSVVFSVGATGAGAASASASSSASTIVDSILSLSPKEAVNAVDAFIFPPETDYYAVAKAVLLVMFVTFLLAYTASRLIRRLLGIHNGGPGIYLTDVATYRDFKPEWTINADEWARRAINWFNINPEHVKFNRMILDRSGIGERSHFPPGIAMYPPDASIASARHEAEIVMFNCFDQLFKRNNLDPKDVDILVVNCSLFNPTPSLAAMIINNYRMREDVVCFNLSGMGCSAGVIAIHLAGELLKTHPKKDPVALVMSMENITQNVYLGNEKAMMVANSLFRMGGAGIMLTRNSKGTQGRPDPKWRLDNLVRVHLGSDCTAYTTVFQDVDRDNIVGVRLDKSLMRVAARALERNMTRLGPLILPWYEKIRFVLRYTWREVQVWRDPKLDKTLPMVVPNFKTAIDHICIHAGGRAVIDEIQKALSLTDDDVRPSRDVLYKFGNTSSSSIWYEFQEVEESRKPKVGEKVWQIAFGSGFKCNSAVWEKVR